MRDSMAGRRSVMTAGALLAGATVAPVGAIAERRQNDADSAWQPVMEPQDKWLDLPGTRHRMVIDTTGATAAASALFFADNFYASNRTGYGLQPKELGVAIVLRHHSTPFGYSDAIWTKYGALLVKQLKLEGEQAVRGLTGNPLLSAAGDKNKDATTLASLAAKGAIFPVCAMATKAIAGMLAKGGGGRADAIEQELHASLVVGAVMAASGIVAINRAQEHGYTFCYVPD